MTAPDARLRRPLVGRDGEIEIVNRCLDYAIAGRGGALLLTGEPGIGKTRLAEHAATRAAELGVPSSWGRCVFDEGVPPFWPWRQILGDATSSGEGTDVPALASLLPHSGGVDPRVGGEPRFELFEEACAALVRAAQPRGLVVVLDDLHWADPSSTALLVHLARALSRSRVVLVATYRDQELGADHAAAVAALVREPGTVHIHLSGLAEVDVADQLEATFGRRFDPRVVAGIARRSQGNPFFVAELGRLAHPCVEGERASAPAPASALPESIRAVVTQRLDRLPPDSRDLLRAGAVIGAILDPGTVAAVADRPLVDTLRALDDATATGLVVDRQGVAAFSHALVRDTLQAELPTASLLNLHRRAAEHLEASYLGDLDRHAAALANHWLAAVPAVDARRGVEWAERAGNLAMAELAYEEAADLYRRGLEAGADRVGADWRSQLGIDLAEALYRAGQLKAAVEACAAAAVEAMRIGRIDLAARAAVVVDNVGDWELTPIVRALALDALADAHSLPGAMRSRLLSQVATAEVFLEDFERVDELSREALALAEASGDPSALLSALRAREMAMAGPDGYDVRVQVADRMIALGREQRSPRIEFWGLLTRIGTYVEVGDLPAAAAGTAALASLVERIGEPIARWHMLRTRAAIFQGQGRFDEAIDAAEQALATSEGPAALGSYRAVMSMVAYQRGPSTVPLDWIFPSGEVDHQSEIMGRLTLSVLFAELGDADRAIAEYGALGPPAAWLVPPFIAVAARAFGVMAAARLSRPDDLGILYDRLVPFRRFGSQSAGGAPAWLGPADLYLGIAAAGQGQMSVAVEHLEAAASHCRRFGARPFTVEAEVELAEALARRAAPGDTERARSLAAGAAEEAEALGMAPFIRRAAAIGDQLQRRGDNPSPLSRRELEIAHLVAQGMTNRDIAAELVVSERTAENHVQHILTKLGFRNRSQIAVWAARDRPSGGDRS